MKYLVYFGACPLKIYGEIFVQVTQSIWAKAENLGTDKFDGETITEDDLLKVNFMHEPAITHIKG